jgi:hypothetical protein
MRPVLVRGVDCGEVAVTTSRQKCRVSRSLRFAVLATMWIFNTVRRRLVFGQVFHHGN